MKQERVNELAAGEYHPAYASIASRPDVLAEAGQIAARVRAKSLGEPHTTMGIRTEVSALLQEHCPVVDPPLKPSTKAAEMRDQLEEHHNHQTAHFQALWAHVDAIVAKIGVAQ